MSQSISTYRSDDSGKSAGLERYLSPVHVWALSFGCAVGWGAFVMPATTFLPLAGPLGTSIGLILGAAIMFIIGINYHYLMNRFQDAGGTLTYTIRILGYDHGFMSAWFLVLVYFAIIWANASALCLISKNLFGETFRFGFHYSVLGYDVYLGEVLLSMAAIFICGLICIRSKRLSAWLQVLLCLCLIGGIIAVMVMVLHYNSGQGDLFHSIPEPYFSDKSDFKMGQIFTIVALSPWAYVGFESVSNSAAGFKFSAKKSLPIMSVALLTSAISYVLLSQISVAIMPGEYGSWTEYIKAVPSLSGLSGLPTFGAAFAAGGRLGIIILEIAAIAGIMTGLIGNFTAGSRLLYTMAGEGMLPEWFKELSVDRTPVNALKFLMGVSLFIPLLGRTAIGWIVDVNTIGATIAYLYTSLDAFLCAKKEKNKKVEVTGIIGIFMSIAFFLYFMAFAAGAMATESYLILASWSILGFIYFRIMFEKDDKKRFGHTTLVWIFLLFLIYFTSLMWVKKSTDDMTNEVVQNISAYYEMQSEDKNAEDIDAAQEYIEKQLSDADRKMTRNSIVQMALNIISLMIMFSIYSIMSNREKQAVVESVKANERSRSKTIFLSNMSHDIRTPMNAIIGYVNLAEDENVTFDELKDYLQKIKASSNHLLALINDVLEMSRIESGKMELEPVQMDLGNVMDELRDLFATQMKEKDIHYVVDASDIRNPYVYCDKNRLNRVLLNLVSNAYKFTPREGTVKVTAWQIDGDDKNRSTYEIRVSDSGIGMSPEFAEKVFDAFERERTSTVSGIQGTGLGMSIVKSIVDMMGGTIELRTAKGEGSEFIVRLPLEHISGEEAEKLKNETVSAQKGEVDFTDKRLLLVDDMQINRQIATKLLEKSGFTVETAENGKEAVDLVREKNAGYYDAVLMDIQMPVMNGYDAAKAIRALKGDERSKTPIVAMTANAFSEDIKKAEEAGMNGHIAKPIDVKNMMEVLAGMLSG